LEKTGDLSAAMVEGIEHWLERETARVAEERARVWQKAAAGQDWPAFVTKRREQLRKQLGVVDARTPGSVEEIKPTETQSSDTRGSISVRRVRWPVFAGVHGEGVVFQLAVEPRGLAIVISDADEIPERSAKAISLAGAGWTVFAPVLVDRRANWSGNEALDRWTNQTHREWLHRPAFEMGRTIVGYEVQKILALLDALERPDSPWRAASKQVVVRGHGEGGLIALLCAALDERIAETFVSGYFSPREKLFAEPLYRNVFGLLRDFGDAELAAMIAPRRLTVEEAKTAAVAGPPPSTGQRKGAAPGSIATPVFDDAHKEVTGANLLLAHLHGPPIQFPNARSPVGTVNPLFPITEDFIDARQRRTVRELEAFTQGLVRVAERERNAAFWSKVKPGAEWEATQSALRERLWREVIGKIDTPLLPPNPQSRLLFEKEKWSAYEVTLDVLPDVFAWGWLLLPRDLKPGERRPVVVCQHGLEGLPEDVVTDDPKARAFAYYKGFAARLAEQGFIVYAPHNPYRGGDKFRMLQRRANPLGLSLFSFILAQHDATTQWLAGLPFADPQRIGFYGLSYGGKTAMRVPALLDRYCLSICSGDFNEWVLKNVSTDFRASYVFTGEWEMPEWNLAFVANYAEMAMLIAPRPFMVERGHDDGVAPDEWVGYEYAKVRRGYTKLGIPERTEIEWFNGPHTINGAGTFEFLHKHLDWPPAQ
jgi:dienelactone hydrolase